MIQIFIKEIHVFLNSLIAYIIIAVFLTGIGLLMWVFPETSVLEYGFADMSSFFSMCPFIFMFSTECCAGLQRLLEKPSCAGRKNLSQRLANELNFLLDKCWSVTSQKRTGGQIKRATPGGHSQGPRIYMVKKLRGH